MKSYSSIVKFLQWPEAEPYGLGRPNNHHITRGIPPQLREGSVRPRRPA